MRVHIWPSEHWVDDEAWATVLEVANRAAGDGGFTIGPHCIRWDVDPERGVEAASRAHLLVWAEPHEVIARAGIDPAT